MPPTPRRLQKPVRKTPTIPAVLGGNDLVPGYVIYKSQCKMKTGALVWQAGKKVPFRLLKYQAFPSAYLLCSVHGAIVPTLFPYKVQV